jgi:hypothetical protein
VCHWKAGRTALAERTFREEVRPLAGQLSQQPADQKQVFRTLDFLLRAAGSLRDAKHPAALTVAREAAVLIEQCADLPSRDLEFCEYLAGKSLGITALLCHLGEPAESLRLAEQGRRLYAALHRAAPDVPEYAHMLSAAWERIAKVRWELGQADEALAAFRESAAVQRQVFERAPSIRAYRVTLSRCYDRLAYWSSLRGDWAAAAAALLEREKLWPDDAAELMKVSHDFRELAEAVGKGGKQLSPQEQAEQQRYLAESERVRRAAEAVRRAARHQPQR